MALFSNFKENTLTWDIKNWVTVVLMVVLGFAILVLAAQLVKQGTGGKINLTPGGMSNTPGVGAQAANQAAA